MLSEQTGAPERRGQSHKLIRELINLRTEMLSLYTKLAASKPFNDGDGVPELLQEFCEILVDYTASAHFQLYRFIDEKLEKRKAVLDVADRVYPRIVEITQDIVAFNDRYETSDDLVPAQLEQDLSRLGELLAERIELEDELIAVLSSERKAKVHSLHS